MVRHFPVLHFQVVHFQSPRCCDRTGPSSGVCASDMELGHWVTGSVGHLGHLSRPGHRVIILTRCETRVSPVFEKMPINSHQLNRIAHK